jgi:cytochrome c biogenesis protein CcdA
VVIDGYSGVNDGEPEASIYSAVDGAQVQQQKPKKEKKEKRPAKPRLRDLVNSVYVGGGYADTGTPCPGTTSTSVVGWSSKQC